MSAPIKIQPQVIDDLVTGLTITIGEGEFLNRITIKGAALPCGNRDIFFLKDGTFEGTGTAMAGPRGD